MPMQSIRPVTIAAWSSLPDISSRVLDLSDLWLTAASAWACALPPPPELACASAFATALLLVPRQFWMAWLLAAAEANASALPLDCARAAASACSTVGS